jgi:aldose 1-epimerase
MVMDASADLLPTGRLIPVKGTQFDLTRLVSIGDLDLDHVFTGLIPGRCARIAYPGLGLNVIIDASPDFTHQVLFSPREMEFFCLENQTCSTDAHNLYDRGFIQESGLKFVAPGEKHTGAVIYRIVQED